MRDSPVTLSADTTVNNASGHDNNLPLETPGKCINPLPNATNPSRPIASRAAGGMLRHRITG